MATLKRWNGSSWVTVPNGSAVKYWNGSSWVAAKGVYYWSGSSWVKCWNVSDPVTLTYDADFTSNIRWEDWQFDYDSISSSTSAKDEAVLMIGRYNGGYPYHYVGIAGFNSSSLNSAMNTRPTVVSARVRLYREGGSGLFTVSGANPLRIGIWTQSNYRSLQNPNDVANYDDWSPLVTEDVDGWARDTYIWVDINPSQINDIRAGKALLLSEVTSGYKSSGGTTNLYSKIGGIVTGREPRLEVTLDF